MSDTPWTDGIQERAELSFNANNQLLVAWGAARHLERQLTSMGERIMTDKPDAPAATDTPETDAAQAAYTNTSPVTSGGWAFARRLERERDGARTEIARLRENAERYQFLTKQAGDFRIVQLTPDSVFHNCIFIYDKSLDAAIDAARKERG